MLDKDKLWVVIYVDVRGLSSGIAREVLNELIKGFNFDESIMPIYIPETEFASKVEVIYYPNNETTVNTEEILEKAERLLENARELIRTEKK